MKTLISILAPCIITIIFFASSWYMGNAVMQTFNKSWQEQFISTLFGILLWMIIIALGCLSIAIYITVQETMK